MRTKNEFIIEKVKVVEIRFQNISSDRLLFGIMLLSSRTTCLLRCFLICVETMLTIIDKKLSSTCCHSHSVLKIVGIVCL